MNSERQQAYLNLIAQLLSCDSGEEAEILNTHPELLDDGLVAAMLEEADRLREQGELNIAKRCHILVWLQKNPQTLNYATLAFNYYLNNLLCSRAKIVFVYHEARKKYRKAQQIVSDLEKKLPKFSEIEREHDRQVKLQKLKELLAEVRTKMFDCAQQVRYLQEDRNTIDTNAENYGDALKKIKILCIDGDNLDFLQKFLDLAENKYQRQIEIDISNN